MKSKLGQEIPKEVKGIVYLCKLTDEGLKVIRELFFTTASQALFAYGNIPNPESQVMCETKIHSLEDEVNRLHNNMDNEEWLAALRDSI